MGEVAVIALSPYRQIIAGIARQPVIATAGWNR